MQIGALGSIKSLKPPNPIVARRISLTLKKQKLHSILNSRSNSSDSTNKGGQQDVSGESKEIRFDRRAESLGSFIPARRKFANSIVSVAQTEVPSPLINDVKQKCAPLIEKQEVKFFSRSIISAEMNRPSQNMIGKEI